MRKISKQDLSGLEKNYPIFNEDQMRSVVGGASTDEIQAYLNQYMGGYNFYDGNNQHFFTSYSDYYYAMQQHYSSYLNIYNASSYWANWSANSTFNMDVVGRGSSDCVLQSISFMLGVPLAAVYERFVHILSRQMKDISPSVLLALVATGTSESAARELMNYFASYCPTYSSALYSGSTSAMVLVKGGYDINSSGWYSYSGHAMAFIRYNSDGSVYCWDQQNSRYTTVEQYKIQSILSF
jgi:hypothetical protein